MEYPIEIKANSKIYTLSKHAEHRAKKRGASVDDIIEALTEVKSRYICSKSKDQRHIVNGKNDIIIVLSLNEKIIITIYNRSKNFYKSKKKKEYNKIRRKLKQQYGNRIKH